MRRLLRSFPALVIALLLVPPCEARSNPTARGRTALAARGRTAPAARGRTALRILLVRHAEAQPGSADPSLTDEGRARAACLARVLGGEGVTHVVTSALLRTKETAAPLAAARSLEPLVRDPMDTTALATELLALPKGSVVLVVGHSNTLPLLAAAFGAKMTGLTEEQGQPALPRDEHDRLFDLRLRPGSGPPMARVSYTERELGCDVAP
jgi:broad specificity phosphatase PhoE